MQSPSSPNQIRSTPSGGTSHLKADVKRFQKIKFNLVEQGISARAFRITALVVGSGKVFADLDSLLAALPPYKFLTPL
jgi:hypothetical protein